MRRWLFAIVCLIGTLICCGCKEEAVPESSENGEDVTVTETVSIYTGDEVYTDTGNVLSEKYALFSEYRDQGSCTLHMFDVSLKTKVLYCFDPGCEHKPSRHNISSGEKISDGCIAYDLGGRVFSLRDDCGYYFQYPELIRTDAEGKNRKTIATVDAPYAALEQRELYTSDFYFRQYVCVNELIKQTDSNGNVSYVFGSTLQKQKVGIIGVSLENGEVRDVFSADDLYDLTILNLAQYQNHLYFTCIGLDVPYSTLPDAIEDPEAYVAAQKEHNINRVYDYDITEDRLTEISGVDASSGIDFINGYMVKLSEQGEPAQLLDMSGQYIRDLPFAAHRLVRSNRNLIAQIVIDGKNMYYFYDTENDTLLKSVEMKGGSQMYLLGAVGDSYYGSRNNQFYYISAEDFWNGAFELATQLTENE